jgi:hypothetical protein
VVVGGFVVVGGVVVVGVVVGFVPVPADPPVALVTGVCAEHCPPHWADGYANL